MSQLPLATRVSDSFQVLTSYTDVKIYKQSSVGLPVKPPIKAELSVGVFVDIKPRLRFTFTKLRKKSHVLFDAVVFSYKAVERPLAAVVLKYHDFGQVRQCMFSAPLNC
mgnify:FL=1